MSFVCPQFKCQTVLIRPIDRTFSGVTTPGQSGSGSNGNEGVLHIPQSSRTGASPSDCLVSYLRNLLKKSYLSAEMQKVRSIAPADWVVEIWGVLSAPALPLLPDRLWPGVVVPAKDPCMDPIHCKNANMNVQ